MKSYNFFAKVYDDLTDNVNYKVRSDYISDFFNKYNVHSGDTILDLACGTGSISAELINLGYKVIGMDLSSEMLSVAASKLNGSAVLLNGNMKNFKLPQKVKGVVCSLDSLNHLADIQEVKQCFNSVYNCLDNNGIFIFDVNTIFKHNNVLANNTFVFDEENYFLSWDNELAENNKVRISVFNTGENIPEIELDRIWKRFYKVDSSRKREDGGTGIGLALVKAIMNNYDNDFGVENKENGVEFYFELIYVFWYS